MFAVAGYVAKDHVHHPRLSWVDDEFGEYHDVLDDPGNEFDFLDVAEDPCSTTEVKTVTDAEDRVPTTRERLPSTRPCTTTSTTTTTIVVLLH